MPPATRAAPAAEPGAGTGGGAGNNSPTPSVSPGRDGFGGISGSSSSSNDNSRASSDSSNNNDSGDLFAFAGISARDLEVFGRLPALQSGCAHEVLVAGLDHAPVLRGCPTGVCHEARGS